MEERDPLINKYSKYRLVKVNKGNIDKDIQSKHSTEGKADNHLEDNHEGEEELFYIIPKGHSRSVHISRTAHPLPSKGSMGMETLESDSPGISIYIYIYIESEYSIIQTEPDIKKWGMRKIESGIVKTENGECMEWGDEVLEVLEVLESKESKESKDSKESKERKEKSPNENNISEIISSIKMSNSRIKECLNRAAPIVGHPVHRTHTRTRSGCSSRIRQNMHNMHMRTTSQLMQGPQVSSLPIQAKRSTKDTDSNSRIPIKGHKGTIICRKYGEMGIDEANVTESSEDTETIPNITNITNIHTNSQNTQYRQPITNNKPANSPHHQVPYVNHTNQFSHANNTIITHNKHMNYPIMGDHTTIPIHNIPHTQPPAIQIDDIKQYQTIIRYLVKINRSLKVYLLLYIYIYID